LPSRWSIRTYREGDEEGIFELFKAVYPSRQYDRSQWMRWWHWMYRENPAGPAKIYLVDEEDKIVAHCARILVDLKVGREIIKAYQVIDFMTHPDSRFKGLFLLERRLLREAEKEGVHITFGFPTEAARVGFIQLGYFDIAYMRPMFKPLNLEDTLKMRINNRFLLRLCVLASHPAVKTIYKAQKPPAMENLTMTEVSAFDDRINELWARVSDSHQIMVVRNKPYLDWRYAPPDAAYTLCIAEKDGEVHGYLVLRCGQQQGTRVVNIFDIVGRSEEVIQCLAWKAVDYSQRQKADFIYCSMIANRTYCKALKRNGFISLPFIKGARFGAYSSSPQFPRGFLKDPQNWFVQLGDSDII
jgi:hypothetical protein